MESIIRKKIDEALDKIYADNNIIDSLSYEVEVPKDYKNGDFTTNVSMKLASLLKDNPRQVSEKIKELLEDSIFEKVEVAGPGFINFYVSKSYFHDYLNSILEDKSLLRSDIGKGKRVLVEFVSANPTGPLHVGHGRGAAYGDSLARVLEACGFDVQREYYINDAGNQMNNLALSIYSRYLELYGINEEFPKDGYKGEYIIDIANSIKNEYQDSLLKMPKEEAVDICFKVGVKEITNTIKKDLENFGVTFDNWFSEKSLYLSKEVEETLQNLEERGETYEKDGALWFNSTKYGDDKDRVLRRGNGEFTYFASDIAYHRNKIKRGFGNLINVWGADHHGYVKRLKSSISALGYDEEMLEVKLVQMVSLIEGGEKISMSTRAGTFVELSWLTEKVGSDAARYFYIMRDINSKFEFDIDLAKSKTSDNPVYYIQYAHARVCSIIRNAKEKNIRYEVGKFLEKLSSKQDIDLIKKLYEFRSVLETAGRDREPHRIAYYLQDLAALFHNYYKNNKILIEDDVETTSARVTLSLGVKEVINFALNLIGVSAPDKM